MHHRAFVESERRRRSLCGDDGTGLVFSCRGLLDASSTLFSYLARCSSWSCLVFMRAVDCLAWADMGAEVWCGKGFVGGR